MMGEGGWIDVVGRMNGRREPMDGWRKERSYDSQARSAGGVERENEENRSYKGWSRSVGR